MPLTPPLSPTLRGALSDAEKRTLARGAGELLRLHERIVRRVEDALRIVEGRREGTCEREDVDVEVDEAVRAVCEVFAGEASNFVPYESFCAGHTEALDTARRAMRAHTGEWMEWERRCAEQAARNVLGPASGSETPALSQTHTPEQVKERTVSRRASRLSVLSTLGTGAGKDAEDAHSSTSTLRRRHSASASTGSLRASASVALKHTKSDPTPPSSGAVHNHGHSQAYGYGYGALSVKRLSQLDAGGSSSAGEHGYSGVDAGAASSELEKERSARRRLAFADYLIKPIQRVCKYPLLFEQLRALVKREAAFTPATPAAERILVADPILTAVEPLVTAPLECSPAEEPRRRRTQAAFSLGGDSDDEEDGDEDDDNRHDAGDTDTIVERALRAMRGVAQGVDEARRRQDLEHKSRLIVDRLVAGAPGGSPNPAPIPIPTPVSSGAAGGMNGEDGHASTEDGGGETLSELGHCEGTTGTKVKPPVRSYSFSSAFSRSRSRTGQGRSGSFLAQAQQQPGSTGVMPDLAGSLRVQIPGPPSRVFLSSLGACLLAGTLDVVVGNHDKPRSGGKRDSMLSLGNRPAPQVQNGAGVLPPSRDPVKVKYLAAFLYVGGYIVLAKAPKAGVYEARHWFSLADEAIEIVDVREDKALLPCSFHLVFHSTGHRLELAAACQREKELWLDAIHHARNIPTAWEYEPVPTLSVSANLVPTNTRTSADIPTVPSVPSTIDDVHLQELAPSQKRSSTTLKTEATVKARIYPGRRQSLTGSGVRSFFMSNNSEPAPAPLPTVLIRRASATRRAQTDRHLADVLSQPLLAARVHAKTHDEVLFRDPDPPHAGAGIGVGALAKNRLTARDSVLVSKQCAPSVCTSVCTVDQRSMISDSASSITLQKQGPFKSISKNSQSRRSLGVHLTLPSPLIETDTRDSSRTSTSSHGPFSPDSSITYKTHSQFFDSLERSQCSSVSTSAPTVSPVGELFPPEVRVVGIDSPPRAACHELPEELTPMDRPKRARSLVGSFRGFFGTSRSLSPSPSPSVSSSKQTDTEFLQVPDAESGRQKNMLSRMLKSTSFRQRERSSSDVVEGVHSSASTNMLLPPCTTSANTGSRPGFLSRSSSLLLIPQRKHTQSVPETPCRSSQQLSTLPSSNRLHSRQSRSTQSPAELRHQKSLTRSIKYRLFPGSLVPLAPMERRASERHR
ncbi:hypothetical protein DFH11DRAFT_1502805 [Phellopilus nigrolimitatus]|nr:hypothetical protein DFH11DRAFT_1502805 [Phellopilus nigrolimitatus]